MQLSVEKLLDRANKGFTERDQNRHLFEDCYEFMLPYRNTFSQTSGTSYNKPTRQYDSTAMVSAANFVNTMQGNFTPVFTRWAELKAGPGIAEKQRSKLNKELEKITDVIFSYLNSSNFSTASAEMYFDWGIGTGALWLFEGDETQPLNFIATPMAELGLVEGRFGTVDGRFRKHKIKARLIRQSWPGRDIKVGDDLQKLIDEKPDSEVELIEACYYDYDEFVWRYEVIYEKSKDRILSEESADEYCFTPRWLKVPGQAYGIGPFLLALLDVKTLNKLKDYMLRSAALNIFGVYTVASSGGFNAKNLSLTPGAFIPVDRNAGPNGPSIQPLPRSGDFQIQEFMVQDLKDQIRKIMLDNRLPEETAQPKTAFEISQRIREFQIDVGSAYGRAMFEYIQPMMKRIISILTKKGLLQLPEGFTIDNFFVQVQVVSPIAQTQAMEDVQKLIQNIEIVGAIAPQLIATAYEIEKLPSWLGEKTGAGASMLRETVEAEQMREQIMQMAAQMVAEQQGAQA